MTRSNTVLNDTTSTFKNKKKTTNKKNSITSKAAKKLNEKQWRKHVLAFYKSDLPQSAYIEKNKIKSHPLRTRFEKSGLRILKKCDTSYADAVIQYDFWFKQWKTSLCSKQAQNRSPNIPVVGFTLYVDSEEVGEDIPSSASMSTSSPTATATAATYSNDNDDFLDRPSIEEVEVEVEEKKQRITKLDKTMMQQLILEFYGRSDHMSLASYIRHVKKCWPNKNAIYSHWKESKLEQLKFADESLEVATKTYNNWCISQQEKQSENSRKNASNKKALPVELECFMRDLIKQLALCGQGLGKKLVRRIFTEALTDGTGKRSIARSILDRFVKNYKLECKSVKNIDPVRISQVTPENRDSFFFRLDQLIKLTHSIDDINCPWNEWSEVEAEFMINIDEMGSDPTKFRDVLLIPEEITNRIFQSTPEGDRVARHLSLLVFSHANGKYKDKTASIEGAAPPMMIHSKQSSKKDNTTAAERRIDLYNDPDTESPVNDKYTEGLERYRNLGMKVCTSVNGSMTKELFLLAMKHLIENLPSKQGASGMYTFLLMDSHVSRWNPQALYLLFKNRIIPIFFPSHLSIVVQPQDNGVILFLHKCIEEAAQLERLFQTDTDISYSNRIVAKGVLIFRDLERKKLMSRGRNSTTRSWKVTGINPCNPYSDGWRENIELYASMNGLKIKNGEPFSNYGVRPKDNGVCPEFTDDDIALLEESVPNFAAVSSGGHRTILNHPKAMSYAVANGIIVNWSEMETDLRSLRPRAITTAEHLALLHMDIAQIITAVPKSNGSLLLDVNYEDRKRDGILTLTKSLETIQIQPNDADNNKLWYTALKVNDGTWHVHNGDKYFDLTTEHIREQYKINLDHNMFPNDKRLQENGYRSENRRRNEKNMLLQHMAKTLAEEERRSDLKEAFDNFMFLPVGDKSFNEFESKIVSMIEKPSNHTVTVKLGTEEHVMKVAAHGNNTSAMSQLVMDNVCKTIIGNSNRKEKKKNKRRGGQVGRVRRGSDGYVKSLQMDQQHRNDLSTEEAAAERKKKNDIVLCKKRLESIQNFQSNDEYNDIWNEDSTIQLQKVKKKNLTDLLRMFDVKGRAKLLNNDPIRAELSKLVITRASIDLLRSNLLQKLEEYGVADTPIVDTSIVDTSIGDENSISNFLESEISAGDENSISNFLESEVSAGDARSGSDTENTADLIANLPKGKTVTFNEVQSVRTISHQAYSSSEDEVVPRQPTVTIASAATSSSSSSSEDEEINSLIQGRTITRSQNKRKPHSIYRRTAHKNSKATPASTRQRRNNKTTTASIRQQRATGICEKGNSPTPTPIPIPPSSKPVVLRKSLRRK